MRHPFKQIFLTSIIVIAGAVAMWWAYVGSNLKVGSFSECVAAGNPVMESYPRQCRHEETTYVEQIDSTLLVPPTDDTVQGIGEGGAVEVAMLQAASDYQVSVNQINLVSVTPKTWPNPCSELPAVDEMCIQVITPGYEVYLRVQGETRKYRVTQDGQIF